MDQCEQYTAAAKSNSDGTDDSEDSIALVPNPTILDWKLRYISSPL